MIKTLHQQMVRGESKIITRVSLDENLRRRDLTGAHIYVSVRADAKIDPTIQLTDRSGVTDWRTGVVISDQDETPGQFVITFVPEDTEDLIALGHDDPWIYEAWIVLASGERIAEISPSNLDIYSEGTTFPA